GVVYDALARERVDVRRDGDRARFDIDLPPAGGRLIVTLPRPIDAVDVQAPAAVDRGQTVELSIRVLDEQGQPLPAALPLQVRVSPEGAPDDASIRYTATDDGVAQFRFTPAINDFAGTWLVEVTDLVAGHRRTAKVDVR